MKEGDVGASIDILPDNQGTMILDATSDMMPEPASSSKKQTAHHRRFHHSNSLVNKSIDNLTQIALSENEMAGAGFASEVDAITANDTQKNYNLNHHKNSTSTIAAAN